MFDILINFVCTIIVLILFVHFSDTLPTLFEICTVSFLTMSFGTLYDILWELKELNGK